MLNAKVRFEVGKTYRRTDKNENSFDFKVEHIERSVDYALLKGRIKFLNLPSSEGVVDVIDGAEAVCGINTVYYKADCLAE